MADSSKLLPQAGTRKGQSRPSSEGSPSYSGGGKNCFVGRQVAGLREHDPNSPITDTECLRLDNVGEGKERETGPRSRSSSRGSVRLILARPALPGAQTEEGGQAESDSSMSVASLPSERSGERRARKRRPPLPHEEEVEARAKRPHSGAEEERSTADIGAEMLRKLSAVDETLARPRTTKGEMVAAFRGAYMALQEGVTELCDRAERRDRENQSFRDQTAALSRRIMELADEVGELRRQKAAATATTPPTGPITARTAMAQTNGASGEETGPRNWDHIAVQMNREFAQFQSSLMDRFFPDRGARPPLGGRAATRVAPPPRAPPKAPSFPGPIPPPSSSSPPIGDGKRKKRKRRKKKKKAAAQKQAAAKPATLAAPSAAATAQGETPWSKVVGRKEKAAAKKAAAPQPPAPKPGANKKKGGGQTSLPRPPTYEAVLVSLPPGSTTSLAAVMAAAKARIRLADLGISGGLRQRKAANGGLLLEIPGPDSAAKAEALAECLRQRVADTGAKFTRPCKTAEMRVMDLDESITPTELTAALAAAGGCSPADVRVGEIRRGPRRLGSAWVRAPLAAVRKMTGARRVQVGWAAARVEALAARPLQCHRCLEMGHVRATCPSAEDRSARCYVCGSPGHKARECTAGAPTCPVCADYGRPANHRLGSKKCSPPKKKKKGGDVRPPPAPAKEGASRPARDRPAEEAMEA